MFYIGFDIAKENHYASIADSSGEIIQEARIDIENFLGKKVYLTTYVKVINNWRDREKYLKEFGLNELEF